LKKKEKIGASNQIHLNSHLWGQEKSSCAVDHQRCLLHEAGSPPPSTSYELRVKRKESTHSLACIPRHWDLTGLLVDGVVHDGLLQHWRSASGGTVPSWYQKRSTRCITGNPRCFGQNLPYDVDYWSHTAHPVPCNVTAQRISCPWVHKFTRVKCVLYFGSL
jgi:hypothetical protein